MWGRIRYSPSMYIHLIIKCYLIGGILGAGEKFQSLVPMELYHLGVAPNDRTLAVSDRHEEHLRFPMF